MFLAKLENQQKKAFMTLAHAIVWADGVQDEGEISMMNQYKMEMNLPLSYDETQGNIEQAISVFASTPRTLKREVIFELVALACAGDDYETEETAMIQKVQTAFEVDEVFLNVCKDYIQQLTALYQKIGELVNG